MELSARQKRRIRQRAKEFAEKWSSKKGLKESKDSEDFIGEFFGIFGIDCFGGNIEFEYELPSSGRIDVFWPGVILIENKSPGKNLREAFEEQGMKYYQDLEDYLRPKYVLVNDFHHFEIYTHERGRNGKQNSWPPKRSFSLNELSENKNISLFYYFFDHKYEIIQKTPEISTGEVRIENSVNGKLIERLVKEEIKKVTHKTRYHILELALLSSLFFTFGYIISDIQPRLFPESAIEESQVSS